MRQSQRAYEKLAESMYHGTPEERERVKQATMSKGASDYQEQLDREYQRGRDDMRREVVEWAKFQRPYTAGNEWEEGYNAACKDLYKYLTQQS